MIEKVISTRANPQMRKELSDSLLVAVDNKKHAENLRKFKAFLNLKCNVYPHEKLDTAKEVILNYHHHVMPLAWISLTLLHHSSLSFIASGRSSGLHPLSSHSCCMHVWAGCPAFAQPYVGVHRSTSHELVLASPAVSCMSGSSNLDSFRDGRQVAV